MRIAAGDAETVTSAWRAMTLAEEVFSQHHDEVDHLTGEAVYRRIAPLIGPLDEVGGFRTTESVDIDYIECAVAAHELKVISQALEVAAEILGEEDYEVWTGEALASARETLERLAGS